MGFVQVMASPFNRGGGQTLKGLELTLQDQCHLKKIGPQ